MDESKREPLRELRYIPINALFDETRTKPNLAADPRRMLHKADIVFGVDIMSGREFLVYGRETLQRIVQTNTTEECTVIKIGIDQETEELELLAALMRVVKGRDDYEPG
jgi:hypothetical protein